MTKEESLQLSFSCLRGHKVRAQDDEGYALNLAGYFCPVCLGKVIGDENILSPEILSPTQEGAPEGAEG